jgi:hypothetical protein
MAQIIKLIWRLDYPISYTYLDKRGAALKVLNDTVERFWDVIAEGQNSTSLTARTEKEDAFRVFSLETNNMNGAIEWRRGTDLSRALQDASFRAVDRIVLELLRLLDIRALTRAGLRVMCTEKFADGRSGAHKRIFALVDGELRKSTEAGVGSIKDVAITFEGETTDHFNYRAIFGPYDKKNVEQALEKKPTEAEYKILGEPDLFFDIDLFETNFSFAEHTLFRWANTKVAKATNFIALCTKIREN